MPKIIEPCYGDSRRPKPRLFLRLAKSPDVRVLGEGGNPDPPLQGKVSTCWHGAVGIKQASAKSRVGPSKKTAAKEVVATSVWEAELYDIRA